MSRRGVRLGLAIALIMGMTVTLWTHAAPAAACPGNPAVDLYHASDQCQMSADHAVAMSNQGDGHKYSLQIECTLDDAADACHNPRPCVSDGDGGFVYTLLQDGNAVGSVCLNPAQAAALGALTPAIVLAAFRRLTWPSADVVLQPPNGRTLVNLPTVFSTDLTSSATQTVTLLGLAVTIEATPVTYTWHGGDASSWATADPGAAYTAGADVDALNTHTYLAAAQVSPSVDVRYHGRYRVAGGAWNDIPQELTVAGPGAPLTVLEAKGLLTGRS